MPQEQERQQHGREQERKQAGKSFQTPHANPQKSQNKDKEKLGKEK